MKLRSRIASTGVWIACVLVVPFAIAAPQVYAQTVSLTPSSTALGIVAIGETSAAKTVALRNSGAAALSITSITASSSFTQTNNCGTSLAAGASCVITVAFAPTATGVIPGTLTITDNASGSPQSYSLREPV